MPSSIRFNLLFFVFILFIKFALAIHKLEKGCKMREMEAEVEMKEEINENKKLHKNIKKMHKYLAVECGIEKDEINFILLGDIGGYEYSENGHIIGHIATPGQWRVAIGIKKYAQQQDFILNLGDNFYDSGICENDREERFKEIFMKVYVESNNLAIPFYSIVGNNDYKVPEEEEILKQIEKSDEQIKAELFEKSRKRAKAQIGYELKGHKNIWNFPAEQYIVHYQWQRQNGKLVNVIFVMIDTFLLCGSSRKDFKSKVICNEKKLAQNENLQWLKRMLTFVNKNWKPDFLFVAGHYPLYVTKGARSFLCAEELQELFSKFNVVAYIAGHEHNLKYIKPINKKTIERIKEKDGEKNVQIGPMIHQIVSGGASRLENCRDEKHISYMARHIEDEFCYPKGVQKKNAEHHHHEGKKNKEEQKEEDDDTVFEGGAFIAVKISEKSAIFDFVASGKEYPIENLAKERRDWEKKVKEIFEGKRKPLEVEMMENGNLKKPKFLGRIELEPCKWDKKH